MEGTVIISGIACGHRLALGPVWRAAGGCGAATVYAPTRLRIRAGRPFVSPALIPAVRYFSRGAGGSSATEPVK